MKKVFFALVMFMLSIAQASSQIFSPNLVGYAGPGTIFYPNGFYQGYVYNGFANGTGTFYWYDGSFYSGGFYGGFYNGPGVMVSRAFGYVSGCWTGGVFSGNCININNPYANSQSVRNEVTRVQQSLPNDARVVTHDPDGYTITRVDPTTPMGKTLLGRSHQ